MPLPTTFAGTSARGEGMFRILSSAAPAATAIWFGQNQPGVSRMTTSGTVSASYSGLTYKPTSMTYGPDGNVWGVTSNSVVVKITPTGTVTQYTISALNGSGICTGLDGNLWVSNAASNSIYKITTSGSSTQYNSPNGSSKFFGIVKGSDGNLWSIDNGTGQMWMITTSGSFTNYSGFSGAKFLCSACDGNIYSPSSTSPYVYKITTSGTKSAYSWAADGSSGFDNIASFNSTSDDPIIMFDSFNTLTAYFYPSTPTSHSFTLSGLNVNQYSLDSSNYMWVTTDSAQIAKLTSGFTRTNYSSTYGNTSGITPGQ
jgi:streptogramin lyase